MRTLRLVPLLAASLAAETHTLTRRQAVDRALEQNPELLIARLEEQKAVQQLRVARDPFLPKVFAGSGLAYSNGFPMSVEGSAPTVVQARAVASVFNRPQSLQLAQARENSRGAALDTQARADHIVHRTLEMWLEARFAARQLEAARGQIAGLEKVAELVRLRVEAGRDLPVESRRAALEIARARLRVESLESEAAFAESSLAMLLGFAPSDRVRAAAEEPAPFHPPDDEESAVALALQDHKQIRRLESALAAKRLEAQSHRAQRWPRLNLIAQYGLFARFNNYEDFFQRFQRHNGQVGLSIEVPILAGSASDASAAHADLEAARLRVQINDTRNRIALAARQAVREVRTAAAARDVARLDLDVARESLSLLLAQLEESRATLRQVEEARLLEADKWAAYFNAQHVVEKARFALLHQTGQLLASVR